MSILLIMLSACDNPKTINTNWTHLSSKKGDIPSPGPSTQQTACLIFDVDKDGKNDFVIGSRLIGPSILWYRRNASGWEKFIVDKEFLPIEAGGAFYDIDGDGDLDIVFGGDHQSSKIWWWENPYPMYDPEVPWVRRIIKNSGLKMHHDEIFGDFDSDGMAELVFWNQGAGKLFLADIPADPRNTQPWRFKEIFTSPVKSEGLAKVDIDLDGKTDIVGGCCWFKREGTRFVSYVIDDHQRSSRVAVGQLKESGRPEVVFVIGDGRGRLKWYEWINGSWVGNDLLGFDVDHGHSLEVVDINGDGKLDIFCGEMRLQGKNRDSKIWLFFGNGKGSFTKKVIAKGFGVHEAKVRDLDGDGDPDILGKPYDWDTPRLDIWLNENRLVLDKWRRHVIDPNKPWKSVFIESADIDGDGRLDIITGGWWYKNPGSCDGQWLRHPIGPSFKNMAVVFDFDSDGDVDILGTQGEGATPNDRFVCAQNNGSGRFKILTNIAEDDGDFLQGTAVGHFQTKGPVEVALSWHIGGRGIQILTVPDQLQPDTTWPLRKISPISQDECLSADDIDRDGDLDLLLGTKWLRNDGSSWKAFWLNASEGHPDRNCLADINGDGRLDAVVGFEAISKKGKLAWYEQDKLSTSLWKEHLIEKIIGPMSLDARDIDNDGDIDIVVGEHNLSKPSRAKLYVFENIDGKGKNWEKHLVYKGDEHHDGARLVDIDGDGDLDIISIGWSHNRVLLYENMSR